MDEQIYKFRIRYEKKGEIEKSSHQEIRNLFNDVIIESGLKFYGSKRSDEIPRTAFGSALSLGYTSECEYTDIYLLEKIDLKTLQKEFKKKDINILSMEQIPFNFPSIESLCSVIEYEVSGDFKKDEKGLKEFLDKKEIIITKAKEEKTIKFNARPQIVSMEFVGDKIFIKLKIVEGSNAKVEQIFFSWLGEDTKLKILKKNMYWLASEGELKIL